MAAKSAEEFRDEVRRRLTPDAAERVERATRAVLLHLRRLLPLDETRRLYGHLPDGLRELATASGMSPAEREGKRLVEKLDAPSFFAAVAHDAGLPVDAARRATAAVFATMQHQVPPAERAEVAPMLPPDLAELWSHPDRHL